MSKNLIYLRLFSMMLLLLTFTQCKKDDDQFSILYGDNTIEGVILYRDARTNVLDTARDAYLELKKFGTDSVNIAARKDLSIDSEKGRFKFSDLPKGVYYLDIWYVNESIVYLGTDTIDTNNSQSIDSARVIEIQFDSSKDYALASLSGQVLVTNPLTRETIPASKARIILNGPEGSSLGKVFNELTDEQGGFTFKNLTAGIYNLKVSHEQKVGNTNVLYHKEENLSIEKNKSLPKEYITLIADDNIDFSVASVSGRALVKDIFTDLSQPAANAIVILKKVNCTEENPSISNIKEYSSTTNDQGDFEITGLPEGCFDVTITYTQKKEGFPVVIEYKASTINIAVEKNATDEPEVLKNVTLTIDKTRILNPLAKVKVQSKAGDPLKEAKVFLYASQSALESDSLKGITSVASGVTNQRGIALFADLDSKAYYINSQVVIDQDTLTGLGEVKLEEKSVTSDTITLK